MPGKGGRKKVPSHLRQDSRFLVNTTKYRRNLIDAATNEFGFMSRNEYILVCEEAYRERRGGVKGHVQENVT